VDIVNIASEGVGEVAIMLMTAIISDLVAKEARTNAKFYCVIHVSPSGKTIFFSTWGKHLDISIRPGSTPTDKKPNITTRYRADGDPPPKVT
jgi:hypothetical protein